MVRGRFRTWVSKKKSYQVGRVGVGAGRALQGPQKALRGGISSAFLEPLVRFSQLLSEKCPSFPKYV